MRTRLVAGYLFVALAVSAAWAQPLGTAFTYQGRLKSGGSPANGSFNMDFKLYPVPAGGTLLASQTLPGVSVSDGLFTVQIDFGAGVFVGNGRWLDVTVNGTPLVPRQELTAAPYALFSAGPWQTNGANSFYSGGNVGIGTATPDTAYSLTVRGSATGFPLAGTIYRAGSGAVSLSFPGPTDTGNFDIWNSNDGWLRFGTFGQERMRITNAGNVGIGTVTPAERLDIGGNTDGTTLQIGPYTAIGERYSSGATVVGDNVKPDDATDSMVLMQSGSTVGGRAIEMDLNKGIVFHAAGGATVAGAPFSSEVARITNAGNVGIGTSAPAAKLHVVGDSKFDGSIAVQSIGTTDNQALELKVNAQRVLRLEPDATSPNVIGGHFTNNVTAGVHGATIAGGGSADSSGPIEPGPNRVRDDFGTVGGGENNQAGDEDGQIDAFYATVGGGWTNVASGFGSTIAGGEENTASGGSSTICGGFRNRASGGGATVAGGSFNYAAGPNSIVLGGHGNGASGNASFAAGGTSASADHDGAFVFADDSSNPTLVHSAANNSFTARFAGGFRLFTNADMTLGARLNANATAWSVISDCDSKRDIASVSPRDVLERLASISISTWTYKDDEDAVPHMGPMSQDFKAAFGLGDDDKSISTLDADGVALAAIQGVNQRVDEKVAEIRTLQQENAELKARLEKLEAVVNAQMNQITGKAK